MVKTHAHHATEWQLQAAAEGKLGAIALPLEEYFAHTVRDDNLDFVMGFVRKVFNEGDRPSRKMMGNKQYFGLEKI